MSKKFSTLVAGLALGTLFSASAQTSFQSDYRTFDTKSVSQTSLGNAGLSALEAGTPNLFNGAAWSQDVNHIQENLLFQLEVEAGAITPVAGDPYVLIQERDYETGKIYLKAVLSSEAPLNASLWTIKYDKKDGVSGGNFTYVNKETGFALTFDHTRADATVGVATNATAKSIVEMNGCNDKWTWYTINRNINPFDFQHVYAYLHDQAQDQVMCLAVVDETTVTVDDKLVTDGMNLNGFLLTAAIYDTDVASQALANIQSIAVQLKPVVANPIIMTAADLNQRMDADFHATNFGFKLTPDNLQGTDVLNGAFVAEEDALTLTSTISEVDGKKFNLNFKKGNAYLLADTARYQEASHAPSVSPSVKFAVKTPKATDGDYMKARYYFKATYFPTNDSLLIEPLNAAVQTDAEYNAETAWELSDACNMFFQNDYTVSNTFTNAAPYAATGSNTVSLTASTIPGQVAQVLTVAKDNRNEFKVKTSVERGFTYLTRTTVADGIYFINLRVNNGIFGYTDGMNIVANMEGNMMYDSPAEDQDFALMPATQWVVEQQDCTLGKVRRVKIYNCEYANQVFEGQLYEEVMSDGKKAYRFIDRTYRGGHNNKGMFNYQNLGVQDVITFTAVDPAKINRGGCYDGYKMFDVDELSNGIENNYAIKYYHFNNDNLYLQSALGQISKVVEADDATRYEIAEATLNTTGGAVLNLFGYKNSLTRKAYVLKLKDANLIDNDKKYIALKKAADGKYYYQAVKKSEIDGVNVKWAAFYLKADQVRRDANGTINEICYVLVDVIDENSQYTLANGWNKANVVDGLGTLRFSGLNDNPDDRASAFYFEHTIRKQYIDMEADYHMPLNDTVKIYRKSGNAHEYLFEDGNDSKHVSTSQEIAEVSYLGIESKGVISKTPALYVDKVVSSKEYMPQYLFAVDVDSIADGYVCGSKTHGYWLTEAEAKATDDNHYKPYNGYVAGRFLVNFSDSTSNKFKYESYTRLGFVEGVHQVINHTDGSFTEVLYVLKNGKTLEDVTTLTNNTQGGKVIDFSLLIANADARVLNGAHQNYAFSLRKINDQAGETADASEGFLLESNGPGSTVGSFFGAWVKIHNGVPVLAQLTWNEDHEGFTPGIGEVINQSQIFFFGTTDEVPTANETIDAAATFSVAAGNGVVTIRNAAGKKVTISNLLGQQIANTVVSSDEATITAPAGMVVVAVEGEAAVKAIVK